MSDPQAIGGMRQRVECTRCLAHRDLTLALRCFICGAVRYVDVLETDGDREQDAAPTNVSSPCP